MLDMNEVLTHNYSMRTGDRLHDSIEKKIKSIHKKNKDKSKNTVRAHVLRKMLEIGNAGFNEAMAGK